MFRNQSLKAKFAGMPKQVRADLALLKGADKNSVDPARQQPHKVVLSKVQRKLPQIVAVEREHVESVSCTSASCRRETRPSKSDIPSAPSKMASPSSTKDPDRMREAASTMNG